MADNAFTGRKRQRTTKPLVQLMDLGARGLITVGGIGTIVAVSTVCLFLLSVVAPLREPADVSDPIRKASAWAGRTPLQVAMDEYRTLGWALFNDGRLDVFRKDTGAVLESRSVVADKTITASSFDVRSGTLTLGFEDGSVQFARVEFRSVFFEPAQVRDPALRELKGDEVREHRWSQEETDALGDKVEASKVGVIQATPSKQLRAQYVWAKVEKPRKVGKKPVRLVAHAMAGATPVLAVYLEEEDAGQRLKLLRTTLEESLETGQKELKFLKTVDMPFKPLEAGAPRFLTLGSGGAQTFVAWESGKALRLRLYPPSRVLIAEELDLRAKGGAGGGLTAVGMVIGRETLVVGHREGQLEGWFQIAEEGRVEGFESIRHANRLWVARSGGGDIERLKREGDWQPKAVKVKGLRGETDLVGPDEGTLEAYLKATTGDGSKLVRAKEYPRGPSEVTAISPSQRSRLVAVGYASGSVALVQTTTEHELARVETGDGRAVRHVAVAPKDNGLAAFTEQSLAAWDLDPRYPEVTVRSLFAPVWYEGYAGGEHSWQSSSGDDATEPKLGLMPLVFGTVKATFYSMLFGVPLALLAAVFTSEFLDPRMRARIKPTIELMASLPSVVLGFLAGLIFAKRVEDHVAQALAAFITLPLAFVLGAYGWQLLPYRWTVRHRRWRFAAMVAVCLPVGCWAAFAWTGPLLEAWLFGGDMKRYLNGHEVIPQFGDRLGGWMLLFLPLCFGVVAYLAGRLTNDWFRARALGWTRRTAAATDLARFVAGFAVAVVAALGLAWLASAAGDARGPHSFIGTYVQRNALVVGFVMGFAIIPLIYTIAEDALSTVPEHLRAASLGAGATPWQTATRIIIPTAMSGLFSACMIGLGRAVGETMIVLMAAGNTPVMEWNLFNGFRTLSANIAVEMPEAVQGSGHYRTLFLAALVLFIMTFAINTVAESVRLRFRKRAYQL